MIPHGGLAYVDFLFVWISFFSLSSYVIPRLLRFKHYSLVYQFLDIPYDHIVITLIDETYLLLSIFIHLSALRSLTIYT